MLVEFEVLRKRVVGTVKQAMGEDDVAPVGPDDADWNVYLA